MNGTARQRNVRNLPRGYFADAQDNTLSTHGCSVNPSNGKVVNGRGDNSPSEKSPAASANSTTALAGSNPAMGGNQFAGPISGKLVTGSGGPGVARDSARHMPTPAGENCPEGLDNHPELGVTACGGPSSPQDCPEIAQQLRAARLLRL